METPARGRRLRPWWAPAAALVILAGGWSIPGRATPAEARPKEWTVLIFMNGKNNLEPFAMENFKQLAQVGSTDKVNFVVQMGRPMRRSIDLDYMRKQFGGWSGAKRFYVKAGQTPDPANAVESVAGGGGVDMGSPAVLVDFLKWGKAKYPAQRYAVVIWNHGQGYRMVFRPGEGRSPVVRAPTPPQARDATMTQRAISQDGDTGSIIYNADLASALHQAFGPELRLVAFDACLMGMVETAYELRQVAPVMVGSEELEPGPGWDYRTVAKAITAAPTSDENAFGDMIVGSYQKTYGDGQDTTMSSLKLAGAQPLAGELSKLSDLLIADRKHLFPLVKAARDGRGVYNDPRNPVSIDLIGFLNDLETQLQHNAPASPALAQVRRTRDVARSMVMKAYASDLRAEPWGSYGLAIYFPATKAQFEADSWSDGYLRSNAFKPIAFVTSERWSLFLAAYLGLPS